MPRYNVDVSHDYRLSTEAVFAVLSDHNRLGAILGVPVRRVVNGHNTPNGEGSVRRMGVWPFAVEETVSAILPNQCIQYRLSRGGAPLRNHRGELYFSATGRGCRVTWTIAFDAPPVLGRVLQQVLSQGLKLGLARIK